MRWHELLVYELSLIYEYNFNFTNKNFNIIYTHIYDIFCTEQHKEKSIVELFVEYFTFIVNCDSVLHIFKMVVCPIAKKKKKKKKSLGRNEGKAGWMDTYRKANT